MRAGGVGDTAVHLHKIAIPGDGGTQQPCFTTDSLRIRRLTCWHLCGNHREPMPEGECWREWSSAGRRAGGVFRAGGVAAGERRALGEHVGAWEASSIAGRRMAGRDPKPRATCPRIGGR